MNLFSLFVNDEFVRSSVNRLELINEARMLAGLVNARVEDCDGRWVFLQTCMHDGEVRKQERW